MTRKTIAISVASMAGLALLLTAAIIWFVLLIGNDPILRAERLVSSRELVGWSADQLAVVLDATAKDCSFPEWDVSYYIGTSRSVYDYPKDVWLFVRVDDEGIIIDARIYSHF